MPEGQVTYAARDDCNLLRYFGRIDYTMAPAIEQFVSHLSEAKKRLPFVFDLREARLLDSTNLGLLARAAEQVRQSCGCRCNIVCTAQDIKDVLLSMGFDEVFEIVPEHPACQAHESEDVITGKAIDQVELLRTMLDAHRTLMGLNEKDREEFKDVVSMLEAEMKQQH